MNNEIINCAEMVEKTFSSIEKSTLEKNNKFYSSWKTVVTKISRAGDSNFGQKLYDHSSIVNVKNGILLVETDHPGWSQMMQFYTKFILKGLKMYIPEMQIDSIAFRVRGSNFNLAKVDYDSELKKENEKKYKQLEKDIKIAEKYEKSFKKIENNENNLPENIVSAFDRIKESMLTKNKNN